MLIRAFVLSTLVLGATALYAQNTKERIQDRHQIQAGKSALDRDIQELAQLNGTLQQLQTAVNTGHQAEVKRLQKVVHADLVREVRQGETKIAAYQREVRQSKTEVRTDNRDLQRDRRDASRGHEHLDDRRDLAASRRDRRDDQRDLRDDQRDRSAVIARVQRQRAILNLLTSPATISGKQSLVREFVQLMKADIADTQRELGEDHRELHEDRRETRDDRRERRERR